MGGFDHLTAEARADDDTLLGMLGRKVVRYVGVENFVERGAEGLVAVPVPLGASKIAALDREQVDPIIPLRTDSGHIDSELPRPARWTREHRVA